MPGFTDIIENKVLDHVLRGATAPYTAPASVWLALYSAAPGEAAGGTEISTGAYARQQITFGAAASGAISNSVAINFPVATAAYTVVAFGIFDASTAGTLLMFGTLTSTSVAINDQLVIPVAGLSVSLD